MSKDDIKQKDESIINKEEQNDSLQDEKVEEKNELLETEESEEVEETLAFDAKSMISAIRKIMNKAGITKEQKDMIIRYRKMGERELVEQEKRLKEAEMNINAKETGTKKEKVSRTKKKYNKQKKK